MGVPESGPGENSRRAYPSKGGRWCIGDDLLIQRVYLGLYCPLCEKLNVSDAVKFLQLVGRNANELIYQN